MRQTTITGTRDKLFCECNNSVRYLTSFSRTKTYTVGDLLKSVNRCECDWYLSVVFYDVTALVVELVWDCSDCSIESVLNVHGRGLPQLHQRPRGFYT